MILQPSQGTLHCEVLDLTELYRKKTQQIPS